MKLIVRSLVVALAVTGAIATTFAPTSAKATISAKTSAMPVPTCAPGSGSCGMDQW
jgi:hypothetical protein